MNHATRASELKKLVKMRWTIFFRILADPKMDLDRPKVKFGKIEGLHQIQEDLKNISCFEIFSQYGPVLELEQFENSLIKPKILTKCLTAWNLGQVHQNQNFISFPTPYSILG